MAAPPIPPRRNSISLDESSPAPPPRRGTASVVQPASRMLAPPSPASEGLASSAPASSPLSKGSQRSTSDTASRMEKRKASADVHSLLSVASDLQFSMAGDRTSVALLLEQVMLPPEPGAPDSSLPSSLGDGEGLLEGTTVPRRYDSDSDGDTFVVPPPPDEPPEVAQPQPTLSPQLPPRNTSGTSAENPDVVAARGVPQRKYSMSSTQPPDHELFNGPSIPARAESPSPLNVSSSSSPLARSSAHGIPPVPIATGTARTASLGTIEEISPGRSNSSGSLGGGGPSSGAGGGGGSGLGVASTSPSSASPLQGALSPRSNSASNVASVPKSPSRGALKGDVDAIANQYQSPLDSMPSAGRDVLEGDIVPTGSAVDAVVNVILTHRKYQADLSKVTAKVFAKNVEAPTDFGKAVTTWGVSVDHDAVVQAATTTDFAREDGPGASSSTSSSAGRAVKIRRATVIASGQPVKDMVVKLGQTQSAVEGLRALLAQEVRSELVERFEEIGLKISNLEKTRKAYEKNRNALKTAQNNVKKELSKPELNPAKVIEGYLSVFACKDVATSSHSATDIASRELVLDQELEMLTSLCRVTTAHIEYFKSGHALFSALERDMASVKEYLDMQKVAYSELLNARIQQETELRNTRKEVVCKEFLGALMANRFDAVKAIIESATTSQAAAVLNPLLRIFDGLGLLESIFFALIEQEVKETSDPSTLFRGKTIITRLLSSYSTLIGNEYLHQTLGVFVQDLVARNDDFEVDPQKVQNPWDQEEHLLRLEATTRTFLLSVLDSMEDCPLGMRLVCKLIQQAVVARFPESRQTCVGGYLFLRFFCPALTTPQNYEITHSAPPPEAQRGLLLISKILQNISNGVDFGAKESYLNSLNAFLSYYRPPLYTFFDRLVDLNGAQVPPLASESDVYRVDFPTLAQLILDRVPTLNEKLEDRSRLGVLLSSACNVLHVYST